MELNAVEGKPIYVQIAEWLEEEILRGHIKEHEKIYSQYQLAEMFNINPATAAKGIKMCIRDRPCSAAPKPHKNTPRRLQEADTIWLRQYL